MTETNTDEMERLERRRNRKLKGQQTAAEENRERLRREINNSTMTKANTETTTEEQDSQVYQWVLETTADVTIGEKPWSSREHVLQERHSQNHSETAVESAISQGLINNDLIEWHGLLAPTDEESLQAILDDEASSDVPRKLLIRKVNRLRS